MMEIKLKRVYDKYEESDGLRIFVDRLWPRGMKREDLHYDIWAKDIAPSNELRKWVHIDKDNRWNDFSIFYKKELMQSGHLAPFIEKIKNQKVTTLLFAAKDKYQNHAIILKELLKEELSPKTSR